MTENTRHSGVSAGLPLVRVSQEIAFPTHRCLFFDHVPTTLAALDNSALTHNVVPVNTAVPSCLGTCIVDNTLPLP